MTGKKLDSSPPDDAGRPQPPGIGAAPKPKAKSSPTKWLKENPNALKIGLVVVLFLVLGVILLFTTGIIGGSGKKTRAVRSRSASASRPRPPAQPPRAGQPGATPAATPAAPGTAAAPPEEDPDEEAEQEPPKRPEDIADWKKGDYITARADADPLLIEAVGHFGERFKGNTSAARMLAELLAPPKADEETAAQPRTRVVRRFTAGSEGAKLIEAIVTALVANGTPEAREFLEQILAGTLPSDDDKTAVDSAVKALAANPLPENEGILFRAMTEPEKFRPERGTGVSDRDLYTKVRAEVEPVASGQFRVELAKFLCDPAVAPDKRRLLSPLVEAQAPENIAAQFVFYEYEHTDEKLATQLESYFTQFSSESLATILGIDVEVLQNSRRTPVRGRGSPYGRSSTYGRRTTPARVGIEPEPPDPDLPYRIASQLWGAEFVASLQSRLGALDSLDTRPQLVALASTIPVDSMRATLRKTLNKHYEDGPDSLKKTGLFDALINDPGFLIVVKTVPREEAKDTKTPSRTTSRTTKRPTTKRPTTRITQPTDEQKAKQAWMEVSEQLVRAWCARFQAAAEAGKADANKNPATAFAIPLRGEAKVTAEYHLVWPGDARAKLVGVGSGPAVIHYVRMEERARPVSVEGFYRRQLKIYSDPRTVADGTWIDESRVLRAEGRPEIRRSLDVMITNRDSDPDDDSNAEADLIVEILSIDTRDPGSG